ncbi:hypothetical protein TruAng_001987 [Truncatella angustata]|nr:hypothetical protein TruAng_001987 [Truncatella angustata]
MGHGIDLGTRGRASTGEGTTRFFHRGSDFPSTLEPQDFDEFFTVDNMKHALSESKIANAYVCPHVASRNRRLPSMVEALIHQLVRDAPILLFEQLKLVEGVCTGADADGDGDGDKHRHTARYCDAGFPVTCECERPTNAWLTWARRSAWRYASGHGGRQHDRDHSQRFPPSRSLFAGFVCWIGRQGDVARGHVEGRELFLGRID